MDMSKFNQKIMSANPDDVEVAGDGPFFADGKYLMMVQNSEEGHGDSGQDANGEWGKIILKVTFGILEGKRQGKEYIARYGLKHPSDFYVTTGTVGLQKLYRALNYQPNQFSELYGRRFIATIKSKANMVDDGQGGKMVSDQFPWNTEIVKYEPAPAQTTQGQTFEEVVVNPTPITAEQYAATGKLDIPPVPANPNLGQPAGTVPAPQPQVQPIPQAQWGKTPITNQPAAQWNDQTPHKGKDEIDEIPF